MSLLQIIKKGLFGSSRIYADYAAATPASPEVTAALARALSELCGNPSSPHTEGRAARALLEEARRRAARVLSVHEDEIVFTSGGTESNNLAILGAVRASGVAKPHIITSAIEHSSVLETFRRLEREGVAVSVLPVDERGRISLANLAAALTPETVLLSLAYANGEIGTVEKLRDISRLLQTFRKDLNRPPKSAPYFHTDASQAALFLSVHPADLGVDLLTLDGLKIHGAPGSGLLYVRRSLELEAMSYGGGQERGLRAGTENVPAALALSVALESAEKMRKEESARLRTLSLCFMKRLRELLPQVVFNSSPEEGLPHLVNVTFSGLDAEFAAVQLDILGISASSASACRSISSSGASYVLEALPNKAGSGSASLRFSFGRGSTPADIERIALALRKIVV